MSYTLLDIEGKDASIPRRDLFDVRFQLISSDEEEPTNEQAGELAFVDAPSDLVPGVYEGGLKTWECSIDLAGYIVEALTTPGGSPPSRFLEVRRVLCSINGPVRLSTLFPTVKIGCGTALPSLAVLYDRFHRPKEVTEETTIYFQDFNKSALELVCWFLCPQVLALTQ